MASACVNNMGMSPEKFLDCSPVETAFPSYGWRSPRISFSREVTDDDDDSRVNNGIGSASGSGKITEEPHLSTKQLEEEILFVSDQTHAEDPDPDPEISTGDFEFFRMEDPVTMLPADELFYDGKLMPFHLYSVKAPVDDLNSPGVRIPETVKVVRVDEITGTDPYLFSPKAPRCSSRWRELLGLKKLYQTKNEFQKTTVTTSSFLSSSSSSTSINSKASKLLHHRSSKNSSHSLKDSVFESVSISSRLSLSSSSSGHGHEDLPRLSLDSDKPNTNPVSLHRNPNPGQPRIRMVKPRPSSDTNPRSSTDNPTTTRVGRSSLGRAQGESVGIGGVSVDSPRMNSSGKIVFQGLGRSSSSPSSFNGGPRLKHRGMERSYSANVRVTPVLNVPVCSLRGSSKSGSVFGFGPLFSSQKRDTGGNGNGNVNVNVYGGGSSRIIQHGNSNGHQNIK